MRFLSFVLVLILGLAPQLTFSQKKFNTRGEAQVRVENNMSKEDARNKARELAKVNAIENVLGTFVEQETTIDVSEGETSFKIIANNKVKGEWIKTKDEDFKEDNRVIKGEFGNETEIWITCKISGTVREIVKARLAFEAVALNCPQEMCRTTRYYDGEPFYLNFVTPSKGFLSIYVVDTENAYRLLPYQEMGNVYADAIPVKADMKYVFFSQKQEQLAGKLVVFSASSGDQSSLPYKEKGHGIFTYFLLKKLQETSGDLSYRELSDYIKENVSLQSVVINSKEQDPQTNVSPSAASEWGGWSMN